jgi:drug/metabolite transporter (DMT)-like permease
MDRLNSTPSWQLAIALFVILLGGMFVGFQLGKNAPRQGEPESGAADSAVKGAVAGLAALLLAFSFSLAAGRYDQRNTLTVREVNSIRNTWLRADLLEEPTRSRI